jgi:murein DD-endopeptidase MepM/ murein hydrolase activator NlpD
MGLVSLLTLSSPSPALATGAAPAAGGCTLGYPATDTSGKTYGITSNMGKRNIAGCAACSKNHKGTDYGTPCGTKLKGPPKECKFMGMAQRGGYGHTASFDCGNGVKIQYAHLQSANSYDPSTNTITTGSSGVGTACHLDYVMTIDGQVVDAQCATGNASTEVYYYGKSSTKHGQKCPIKGEINLCDPETREALKNHSKKVWSGSPPGYDIKNGTTTGGPGGGEQEGGTENTAATPDGQENENPQDEEPPIEEPQPPPEETPIDPADPESPYNPEASKPRCDNSTCITQPMIENAKHKRVDEDKAKSHNNLILPPKEGECPEPHKTGVMVHRQTLEGEYGKLKEYIDAFCTNQGCTYVNEEREGIGTCELPN